jgi:hypothetical protein
MVREKDDILDLYQKKNIIQLPSNVVPNLSEYGDTS